MTSRILLSFLLCLMLWLTGLAWFVWQIPTQPARDDMPTDAIVVLTGGGGRMEYGLQLLIESKGKKLFVSGVSEGVTLDSLLRQVPAFLRGQLTPEATQNIVLGHQAVNTIGNAEETARWLHAQGYASIRLVTANYHMPRSIEEFEEAAPGVVIVPAPVFPDNFTLAGWWHDTDSRILVLLEYHKFLASKLRHWMVSVTHRS